MSTSQPITIDTTAYSWNWIDSGFILTLVGLLGAGSAYCLTYFLKSRCTRIKCGCIECIRDPITEDHLNEVQIVRQPNPAPNPLD
jgi:hypothetical protein